jgi:hypothetical protein
VSPRSLIAHYAVRLTIRAPLPFVYGWCTDYTSQDGRYSGEGYERRIIRRSLKRVEFEDLYDTEAGWVWIHRSIRLLPPNAWHADSTGSDRALSVDYRLRRGAGITTELSIRAARRPYGIGRMNPRKASWEAGVARSWANFARVLERDYKKLRSKRVNIPQGEPLGNSYHRPQAKNRRSHREAV